MCEQHEDACEDEKKTHVPQHAGRETKGEACETMDVDVDES